MGRKQTKNEKAISDFLKDTEGQERINKIRWFLSDPDAGHFYDDEFADGMKKELAVLERRN